MRTCEQCGRPLKVAKTGRPPRFCNQVCRQRAHRARANAPIAPSEMTSLRRWVQWRPVRRGGRWTKLPTTVAGAPASSTNPATWTSFEEAVSDPKRRIGFVLGDGIGCIDLDHCLIDGHLTEGAAEILSMLPATWVEVSPSGDGLHIWGRFSKEGRSVGSFMGQPVEIYTRGRYITVTGQRFKDAPVVLADLGGVVNELI